MKKLFIVLLALIAFSCTRSSKQSFEQNSFVKSNFNNNELEYMHQIVKSFDSIVLSTSSKTDINEAYNELFSEENFGIDFFKLGFNKLSNRALVSNPAFSIIWRYEYGCDRLTKDTLSVSLIINLNGKYFKLLENVSKGNKALTSYVHYIHEVGAIPPTHNYFFFSNNVDLNYNNEVYRLLAAVHYISLSSYKDFVSGKGHESIESNFTLNE
jgi:hypothetical protein